MKPGDIVTWKASLTAERVTRLELEYGPGPYVIQEPSFVHASERHWRLYRMCDGEIFQHTSFNQDMLRVCTFLNAARKAIQGKV